MERGGPMKGKYGLLDSPNNIIYIIIQNTCWLIDLNQKETPLQLRVVFLNKRNFGLETSNMRKSDVSITSTMY